MLALYVQCLPTTDERFPITLQALENAFARLRGQCRIDYCVYGLSRGLIRAGRKGEAKQLLQNFVTCGRRDRAPESVELQAAIAECTEQSD